MDKRNKVVGCCRRPQPRAYERGSAVRGHTTKMHLVDKPLAHKLAQGSFERLPTTDLGVPIRPQNQHMSGVQVPGQKQKQAQTGGVRPVQIVEQHDQRIRLCMLADEAARRSKQA